MLKLSTLTLLASLTIGLASIGAITTANAMAPPTNCPPTRCPPPDDDPPPEYEPPPPPPPGGKVIKEYELTLSCDVNDDEPVTDDFFIVNIGSDSLPAGLKIRYQIPETGERGVFLLPREVLPGKRLVIPGLLEAAPSESDCRAVAIT